MLLFLFPWIGGGVKKNDVEIEGYVAQRLVLTVCPFTDGVYGTVELSASRRYSPARPLL